MTEPNKKDELPQWQVGDRLKHAHRRAEIEIVRIGARYYDYRYTVCDLDPFFADITYQGSFYSLHGKVWLLCRKLPSPLLPIKRGVEL